MFKKHQYLLNKVVYFYYFKTSELKYAEMKEITVAGIGRINFIKNRKAKYVRISVRSGEPVRVSVPFWVSYNEAEKILLEKFQWVKSKVAITKLEEEKKTVFFFNSEFSTKKHKLVIYPTLSEKFYFKISAGIISAYIPKSKFIGEPEIQAQVRSAVVEALRIEAKEYLPGRVNELAGKFKLDYSKTTVKNLKSQWGSCSRRKNINLNLHLMRLPYDLIDYVILHELAHTKFMNHSTKYWSFLNLILPGAKVYNKKLKTYSIAIW